MPPASSDPESDRWDVAIVGGGPAGSAAATFTARYGLDTVVFDAGPSSLRRCAVLENYLGFPAGIDIETFLDLAHAQLREAGATLEQRRVESVTRSDDAEANAFTLDIQGGEVIEAEAVIAATRSDAGYLRPLGGDAMFETHEYDGETHEHFDPDFPDGDGRTTIEGLYVASPAGERDVQAIVAAGQGAHVARRLLADRRAARGFPDGLDEVYDWLRPDSEFAGDWGEREQWREWFDARIPDDREELDGGAGADADETDEDADESEELATLREEYVDEAMATRRSPDAIEQQTTAGLEALVDVIGTDRLLSVIDDDRIREHLEADDREVEARSDG